MMITCVKLHTIGDLIYFHGYKKLYQKWSVSILNTVKWAFALLLLVLQVKEERDNLVQELESTESHEDHFRQELELLMTSMHEALTERDSLQDEVFRMSEKDGWVQIFMIVCLCVSAVMGFDFVVVVVLMCHFSIGAGQVKSVPQLIRLLWGHEGWFSRDSLPVEDIAPYTENIVCLCVMYQHSPLHRKHCVPMCHVPLTPFFFFFFSWFTITLKTLKPLFLFSANAIHKCSAVIPFFDNDSI